MKLSVIIVNYNVRYFLEQALQSVRKASEGLAVEVWVVDNNSVDDSVAVVREKFPEVKLIANQDNPGFAIANNQAIRQSTGEYVLLLNPDTVVEEDTFRKCLAFMDAHPRAGGLGIRMIDGSGKFLPESKRGFPSPWVAFCKTVGLSALFPKSRRFNRYYLGYLDEHENHRVEVLAGAFMLLRRSVLDEVGLLDEAFFMYGEDIDLSYRIVKAGYENYYFADSRIIHYKGESTKKGSLNYVRVFYQAMIIFARKHFSGRKASLFVLMLQAAIYLRATLTLLANGARRLALPLADLALMFLGLYLLRDFWAVYHFNDPGYYPLSFLYFNAPLYAAVWLTAIFFSGGYDRPFHGWRLIRGLAMGTVIIAAIYGFLDQEYRSSRMLILLGAGWTTIGALLLRSLVNFLDTGSFGLGGDRVRNLVIAGSPAESERVLQVIRQAEVRKNYLGFVGPDDRESSEYFLSTLDRLPEVVDIYKVDELIFCARDIPSDQIMHWMTTLGPEVEYKILPEESMSIVGSSSKHTSGELYTIDIRFNIATPANRRNKRLLDVLVSLVFLLTMPLHWLWIRNWSGLVRNVWSVFTGRRTWVGYAGPPEAAKELPALCPGVLSPQHATRIANLDERTIRRLNFLYAKDYSVERDLEIVWKGMRETGRR